MPCQIQDNSSPTDAIWSVDHNKLCLLQTEKKNAPEQGVPNYRNPHLLFVRQKLFILTQVY